MYKRQVLYGLAIILLIAVLFAKPVTGATSSFNIGAFSLQPGEFSKVAVILFLTFVITKIQRKGQEEINRPTRLSVSYTHLSMFINFLVKKPL